MLEKVSRQHPQPNNVNQFTSVSDPEQPGPSAFGRTVGACAGKTFLGLIWTKSSRKQESVHLALKQRDSRNKRLPSLGYSFAQRKRSLIPMPSTKTGVVTMEVMPQQIPPYLEPTYICTSCTTVPLCHCQSDGCCPDMFSAWRLCWWVLPSARATLSFSFRRLNVTLQ